MLGSVLALVLALVVHGPAWAEPVTLSAADGVKIYGEYWPAASAKAPLILAFHQAGSSHAEYAPLAARLNRAGFGVLAIDQRSGGGEFGGNNRTVAVRGRSAPYDAALTDLEAALVWGQAHVDGAPLLVWGSSYSAALVFLLAAKHPGEVQALLAFSPGEYLGKRNAVGQAARTLRLPVFVDQASAADEIAASRAIFEALPGTDKTLFVPATNGVHGTATLRSDRNASGAEENWGAVMAFLSRFKANTASVADVEALLASALRTPDDRKSDAGRQPAALLRFAQVAPGMNVLDVSAGGGYTTQLMALAVGPQGKVWAQAPKLAPSLERRLAEHPQANIELLLRSFEDPFPVQAPRVDLVTLVLSYHDIAYAAVDRARMNRAIFDALKPGGHLLLIDHAARPGSGIADTRTLHRIDEQTVRSELSAAGFVLENESDFLRNPADPRDQAFFDMNMPADRFALRFVKPR